MRDRLATQRTGSIDEKKLVEMMTLDEREILIRAIRRADKAQAENPAGEGGIAGHMTEEEQITIARAIARIEKQNSLPIEDQVALKVKELQSTPGAFDTGPDLETLSKSSARQRRKKE